MLLLSVMVGFLRIFPPTVHVYGNSNTNEHALSCPTRAFPTIRHNDIRDLTAKLISEVCHNVSKEPSLQPESHFLSVLALNWDDGAHLDIKASGFWDGQFQSSFYDVGIFDPYAL